MYWRYSNGSEAGIMVGSPLGFCRSDHYYTPSYGHVNQNSIEPRPQQSPVRGRGDASQRLHLTSPRIESERIRVRDPDLRPPGTSLWTQKSPFSGLFQ
jgi:hypothetical protein